MLNIAKNYHDVYERIVKACQHRYRNPDEVTLVAITKGVGIELIESAFKVGIDNFGENRVREAASKIERLSSIKSQISWHMVGHLQTNKAKLAAQLFDCVQSVDSVKLAQELNKHASKELPVLLQVNVSKETTKSGFTENELNSALVQIKTMKKLKTIGLMTIPPVFKEAENTRPFFRRLRELRDSLQLKHLSMGMTDDFEIAIEEGATIVRIGRALFGERGIL